MSAFDELKPLFNVLGKQAVADMQKNLKAKIVRKGAKGTYNTDTIASGKLYKSLRFDTKASDDGFTFSIYGTDYWKSADSGTPAGTSVSPSAIQKWLNDKTKNSKYPFKVLNSESFAQKVVENIKKRGTLPPASNFATKAMITLNANINNAGINNVVSSIVGERLGKIIDASQKELKPFLISV
jgi:hypothetical protein